MEEWRDIPGYEGAYQVSNRGRVRNSLERVLSPWNAAYGYLKISLYRKGKRSDRHVHKLVAVLFLGARPTFWHQINHRNLDKTDNAIENLEWVTQLENTRHAQLRGRLAQKLNRQEVLEIVRLRDQGWLQWQIANRFQINQSCVSDILRGVSWAYVTAEGGVEP